MELQGLALGPLNKSCPGPVSTPGMEAPEHGEGCPEAVAMAAGDAMGYSCL